MSIIGYKYANKAKTEKYDVQAHFSVQVYIGLAQLY